MGNTRRFASATAVVAAAVLTAAGTAGAAPSAAPTRGVISVHTTSKHIVAVGKTTRPGLAEFRNTGSGPVLLVAPLRGASTATLAKDLNADSAAGLIAHFSVADLLPAQATSFVRLGGRGYYLVDLSTDTFSASDVAQLRIAGSPANATAPRSTAVTVTTHDILSTPKKLARVSQLRLSNNSSHLQELFSVQVKKSATAAQLKKFLAKPNFVDLDGVAAGGPAIVSFLSPRASVITSNRRTAGRYLLLSIEFDGHTTEPALARGRVTLVTVT